MAETNVAIPNVAGLLGIAIVGLLAAGGVRYQGIINAEVNKAQDIAIAALGRENTDLRNRHTKEMAALENKLLEQSIEMRGIIRSEVTQHQSKDWHEKAGERLSEFTVQIGANSAAIETNSARITSTQERLTGIGRQATNNSKSVNEIRTNANARKDPFTGSQAQELIRELREHSH